MNFITPWIAFVMCGLKYLEVTFYVALAAFAGRYFDVYDEWNVCLSFFKVVCGAVFEPRR